MKTVVATFHATYPPYVAGDVAGLSRTLAEALGKRGIVTFVPPAVDLDALDRDGLVALARDRLGLVDAPPEDVSDDELRDALRAGLAAPAPAAEPTPANAASLAWDRLEVMDRLHLEAFARTKCGMGDIDAALTDDELRGQIRAVAGATLNAGATAEAPAQKRRRG